MISETSCEWLIRVTRERIEDVAVPINTYIQNRSLGVNRPGVLVEISERSKLTGLSDFFIRKDVFALKRNFYVVGKLLQKSHSEGWDAFANYAPLLYGLLSDSPEIYSWLARTELKNKDDLRSPHFLFHQFQLVLQSDDSALRETIAKVARGSSKQGETYAQVGADFFPLLLKRDKNGLQVLIEKLAMIKSAQEPEGRFIAGLATIHAKLCWYRGLEVKVLNSLVPMPLMPIKPLETYEIEYDFLRADWTPPPPPGFFAKAKRLFSGR